MFLALDLGTTHLKAALFDRAGCMHFFASQPTPLRRASAGYAIYHPQEIWETVLGLLAELYSRQMDLEEDQPEPITAVGITSMAETGLLVERSNGAPRTPFLPWFDRLAESQVEALSRRTGFVEEFCRHGVRPTFKCSLAKLLWLYEQDAAQFDGAIWLSAADYIAYRLTGTFGTHASLAVRTAAFCLDVGEWDARLLDELGLPAQIFPPVLPAFDPAGEVRAGFEMFGLAPGIPVIIGGHDHLCGAFAAYTIAGGLERLPVVNDLVGEVVPEHSSLSTPWPTPGAVYQSIGTAESLLGAFPARPLGEADYRSGFSFSRHASPGWMAWVGGISASGGSVEWLRGVLGEPRLPYAELDALLKGEPRSPTGIVYLPYLSGSGSPHSDGRARAAFIGLNATHKRADLYQSVLEGVAYEVEYICQAAQSVAGRSIQRLLAAGGGTRNRAWMQIRADVLGYPVEVLGQSEMTLLGAALLAGLGAGVYPGLAEVSAALPTVIVERYIPDAANHALYNQFYDGVYKPLLAGFVKGESRSEETPPVRLQHTPSA